MDKLLTQLSGYLAQAHDTIVKYGPNVWDATLQLIRTRSLFMLISWGLVLLLCLGGVKWITIPFFRHCQEEDDERWVLWGLHLLPLAVFFVFSINALTDFDTWLGALSPQLYILYHIAQKAGVL